MREIITYILVAVLFFVQYNIGYSMCRRRFSRKAVGTLNVAKDADGIHLFLELDRPAEEIYWADQVQFRVRRLRVPQK